MLRLNVYINWCINMQVQLETEEKRILKLQNQILKSLKMEPLSYPMRPLQLLAVMKYIYEQTDVACFLPTSYGKTLIAQLCAIYEWVVNGRKTILIALAKSLNQEQFTDFNKYLPTIIDNSDHNKTKNKYESQDWVVACMTPEKFDLIMSSDQRREKVLGEVGLIINDEVHTLGEEGRGDKIENYILLCRATKPDLRFVHLSATVGNPEHFAKWLNAELILATSKDRPVPLQLDIKHYEEAIYPSGIPDFKTNQNIRLEILNDILNQYPDDQFLIFVTSRPRTEFIAKTIVGTYGKIPVKELVDRYHVAFHNASLTLSERLYVETAFKEGRCRVIVATPTLAVGVNLPAPHCVLFDVEQFTRLRGQETLKANRIQQTIGRAGRSVWNCRKCKGKMIGNVCSECGWENFGIAHVITPIRLLDEVISRIKNAAIVESQLKGKLYFAILKWVVAGAVKDIVDIFEVCRNCYEPVDELETLNAVDYLTTFGFLKANENGVYSVTQLGYRTVTMYIDPKTVVYWRTQICNIQNPENFKELFIRLLSTPEFTDNLTVRKEDDEIIGYGQTELGLIFPKTTIVCEENKCLYCSKKIECQTKGCRVSECEEFETEIDNMVDEIIHKAYFVLFYDDLKEKYLPKKYNNYTKKMEPKDVAMSGGDRKNLMDATGRMFAGASMIFSDEEKISKNLKLFTKMCEAGTLRFELIDLCKLKRVGIATAQLLYDAGIETIDDFQMSTPREIAKILGKSERFASALLEINFSEGSSNDNVDEPEEDDDDF